MEVAFWGSSVGGGSPSGGCLGAQHYNRDDRSPQHLCEVCSSSTKCDWIPMVSPRVVLEGQLRGGIFSVFPVADAVKGDHQVSRSLGV